MCRYADYRCADEVGYANVQISDVQMILQVTFKA